jgi:3',5'-cyclic-AMP phosphodiesterase
MRILQLSDPHLLADPAGRCHGRPALDLLHHGLQEALRQLRALGEAPDLLLISGDLCDDESWGGYVRLGKVLQSLPLPVALLPGNHDHPALLRAALGRRAMIAPALVRCGHGWLLLLDSHCSGDTAGELGPLQLDWLQRQLAAEVPAGGQPLLVAVHHPPVPIGDTAMDAIRLRDGAALIDGLRPLSGLRGLVFGHVHQHWQGDLPGRPEVPLLGCPSTLRSFPPVQCCPLERPDDPGGRWLEIGEDGVLRQRLLRWAPLDGPSLASCNAPTPCLP